MAIFPNFFFRQYRPGKCLLRQSRTKKCLSSLEKQEVQKVEKLTWFKSKNGQISSLFLKAIQAKKMSFTIFQNKKAPFYTIKTRNLKNRTIDLFLKGLTHGFGPKMAIFRTFFQAIQARKMSFTIFWNEKRPFSATETRSSKSLKIAIFPRRLTHGFCPKKAIFPTFFLTNIGQENVFYDILERKNAFLGHNLHLSKGVNKWFRSKNGHCSNFFFDAIMARKMFLTIFQKEKTPFVG